MPGGDETRNAEWQGAHDSCHQGGGGGGQTRSWQQAAAKLRTCVVLARGSYPFVVAFAQDRIQDLLLLLPVIDFFDPRPETYIKGRGSKDC